MVTGPEARILARLVTFPPSLESAWDVPRDICLPGLAEYLGVVRSALHTPLNELIKKELIVERKAHVIGGGTRKRKVYHITKLGRAECQEISIPEKKKVGELLGKPPSPTFLHGRDQLIGELKDIKKLIITGLPGIGKTSLLRKIADELVSEGKTVRYATAESFKDIVEIFTEWELKFSSENAVLNETKNEVLILDELQEISQRHLGRLEIFASKVQHLVMASRAPLPISEGFEVVEIPPLEISDAIKLLPTHLDNRKLVAERLGGHPLALQMHDENTAMPEAGTDLQNWVEQVVLSGLGEEIVALDELSLLPVPVPAELLNHQDYLFDLDDHALLRWFENGVELHHLVRNVRSTMLTSEHHQEAAKYWSKIEGDLARLVEIHHALNSDGDVESLLIKNAESLMVRSSAGLATLIGDALFRTPSQNLSRIAAMVAIERGEAEIASKYLLDCDAPDLEFSLAILMGESDVEIPKDADFRLLLSEASRRLDDRLPDEDGSEEVLELLNQIDVSSADKELRKVILVAIAHIRHAWFISTKNWSKAAEIRTNLESLTHQNDSQLEAMRLRSEIAQTPSNSPSFDKLIETAFSKSGLRAKMLQVSLVQRCEESRAKSILNRIELPSIDSQNNLTSARRIAATIWYLRALYKTHNSLSSMAEAISLWKLSLCPKAASNATEMMHKLL
ncbi:MAG: ATP-binding protein [Candidatus Poseidoniales archaeon]|nr:ATP-binding protein [Candidatus Poseidoniales archaeon]